MKVYHRWNSAGSFGPAALRPVGFYGQVFVQAQRREAWGARYKPNAVRRGVAPAKGVAAHPRRRKARAATPAPMPTSANVPGSGTAITVTKLLLGR